MLPSRQFLLRTALTAAILAASTTSFSQPSKRPDGGVSDFLRCAVGEWVGTCEQTTDGERADNKYFHVTVVQTGDDTYESRFEYYRLDRKTGAATKVGESTVVTAVDANGTGRSTIAGKGSVLVYDQPKAQRHELTEVVRVGSSGGLESVGRGTIKVSGMPFGLGKCGKLLDARSCWTLKDGVLTVRQTLKLGFRALFFSKKFDVVATYTARRGSDLASLGTQVAQVPTRPSRAVFQ